MKTLHKNFLKTQSLCSNNKKDSVGMMTTPEIKKISLTIFSSIMFVGCASKPSNSLNSTQKSLPSTKQSTVNSANNTDDDSMANLLEAGDKGVISFDDAEMRKYGDVWQRMRVGFQMDLAKQHRRIDEQKGWFITRQKYIDKLTARASYYLYYTVAEAQRRGIPTELALLPIIESSYDPSATSNASAAGMWQFIPSTGKIYGLKQTDGYDGRRDVIESTRAAYDFLTSLYNKFGSWELALAAYNAGPGRVQKAINTNKEQGYPTDFWSLSLPQETMHYVPRFLAVANIVQNPSANGVRLPRVANRPFFRSVPVASGISLNQIAQQTGVDYDTLADLNPAFIQGYTNEGSKRLLVPVSLPSSYDTIIANLQSGSPVQTLVSKVEPTSNQSDFEREIAQSRQDFYNKPKKRLPTSASALAEFASNASVPDQTFVYIPVKSAVVANATVTENEFSNNFQNSSSGFNSLDDITNTSGIALPPAITSTVVETENQKQQAEALSEINALPTSAAKVTERETVVASPALSVQERAEIAREIKNTDPSVQDVIDPLDGQIKLEAIQTQQSVLAAKGKKKQISFKPTSSNIHKKRPHVKKDKPTGKRTVYKVVRGDSLKKIGKRHGLYWRDIAEWNDIDPSASLYVGTPLYLYGAKRIVPVKKEKPTTYTVQRGDTMIGVANEFNMKPSVLARMNGMKALDNLIIGQRLSLVPTTSQNTSQSTPPTPSSTKVASNNTKSRQKNANSSVKTKIYRVQSGDGLIQLAKQFGMTTEALADLNDLSTREDLYVGQRLKIPAQVKLNNITPNKTTNAIKVITNVKPTRYTVTSGDTMIGVANKFGMRAGELARMNNMKALDDLIIGQQLTLVDDGKKSASKTNSKQPNTVSKQKNNKNTVKTQRYTVKSGDGLIQLAKRFGMTTTALASLNNLSPTQDLLVGQRINIPADIKLNQQATNKAVKAKTKPTSYKVSSGDTMIGVANKFGMSAGKLAKMNGMKALDDLIIGQTLTLVDTGSSNKNTSNNTKQRPTTVKSKKKISTNSTKNASTYVVESGDTMIYIARKHGLSINKLAQLNGLKPFSDVRIGQRLTLVSNAKTSNTAKNAKKQTTANKKRKLVTYQVKAGDGLIQLARRYNISVEELAKINKMKATDNLLLGRTIKVPKK